MSCYMTLSEVLPSLPYRFVYWFICYLMPETWNINSVIHRSYSPCSWKVLPHFVALEKCCIRIRNLSAVFGPFGTVAEFAVLTHSPSTHIHTWPCHAFFAKVNDFFAPGAHPDGKEIGMWRYLALLSLACVYALCTFVMERCPIGPKFCERRENFNRWKAYK